MTLLFFGFFFIFLNLDITFDFGVVGLLPNFIGYIFFVLGLRRLDGSSDHFNRVVPYSAVMLVYSLALYILDLTGIVVNLPVLSMILSILGCVIGYYIDIEILRGIEDLEHLCVLDLNVKRLRELLVGHIICAVIFIPGSYFSGVSILSSIVTLAFYVTVVITLAFLVFFAKSMNLYNHYVKDLRKHAKEEKVES